MNTPLTLVENGGPETSEQVIVESIKASLFDVFGDIRNIKVLSQREDYDPDHADQVWRAADKIQQAVEAIIH